MKSTIKMAVQIDYNNQIRNELENITIISYNCHGFNQGVILLNQFCDKQGLYIDLICIQEHWLTSNNLFLLENLSKDYEFIGISAMDDVTSNSVLKGRPFGGCGFLIKSSYAKNVTAEICKKRFAIIIIDTFAYITVYLAKFKNEIDLDILVEILSEIEECIVQLNPTGLIFCGDLNMCLHRGSNSIQVKLFLEFLNRYQLSLCNLLIHCDVDYTYCHESLQHYSYIDYFAISDNITGSLVDFNIFENAMNLSDHNPVFIKVLLPKNTKPQHVDNVAQHGSACKSKIHKCLRWDHADLAKYYEHTRSMSLPILDLLTNAYDTLMDVVRTDPSLSETVTHFSGYNAETFNAATILIEKTYGSLVHCLASAAEVCIPKKSASESKFWWDDQLTALKNNSVASNSNWIAAGRPMGPLLEQKIKDKRVFQYQIKPKPKIET